MQLIYTAVAFFGNERTHIITLELLLEAVEEMIEDFRLRTAHWDEKPAPSGFVNLQAAVDDE